MPVKKTGIIYLQKDRLQLYVSETAAVIELLFPPQLVRDIEIVDKENFEALINSFLFTNKMPPIDYVIVIADNASFLRDFSQPSPSQPQNQQDAQSAQSFFHDNLPAIINTFIEHVPFEHVVSKTFPLPNGTRVFATNKDLYDDIQNVFEKQGSSVSLIIPAFIIGTVFVNKPVLDVPAANFVLEHSNALKQYDILEMPIFSAEKKSEEENEYPQIVRETPKQKEKKRLFLLVGVFVLLVAILIVVIIMNASQLSPTAGKTARVQSAESAVTPFVPTPTVVIPTQVSVPLASETHNLTVSIMSSSTPTIQSAQTLQTSLQQFKFNTLTVGSQNSVTTPTTIVTFSTKPSNTVRTAVIEQVRKVSGSLTIQDKPDATVDISILLAP